jgi:hypothetical protein
MIDIKLGWTITNDIKVHEWEQKILIVHKLAFVICIFSRVNKKLLRAD